MNEILFYNLTQTNGLTHSLATQIARELGRRIVAGLYPQGTCLEDEMTLAEKYRVSRSVIRDAENSCWKGITRSTARDRNQSQKSAGVGNFGQ